MSESMEALERTLPDEITRDSAWTRTGLMADVGNAFYSRELMAAGDGWDRLTEVPTYHEYVTAQFGNIERCVEYIMHRSDTHAVEKFDAQAAEFNSEIPYLQRTKDLGHLQFLKEGFDELFGRLIPGS